LSDSLRSTPVHVIAAGKAAADMAAAWVATRAFTTRVVLVVSTHRSEILPSTVEYRIAGHPLPDERSVAAADRALEVARAVAADHALVVLLSGGASAVLARPMSGISLGDKQRVVDLMLRGGADIHALNSVRKHISAIKGGRLAAACRGRIVTLAISDVVGDDLTVIGSGPAVPDPSTWRDAWHALNRSVPHDQQPVPVRTLIAAGLAREVPETPKAGDAAVARAEARVIASRMDAMRGAREAAERLGYRVTTIGPAVTGEARNAALAWLATARAAAQHGSRMCVISSGETTVRVRGGGRGGRNQEFALALARPLAGLDEAPAVASVGTDGIDGPTAAAGAIVDSTTRWRAQQLGIDVGDYLEDNNSHAFFAALGDLIVTGPTGTNVGDLQVAIL
jgi:glycerate-2-kinase